MDTNFVFGWVMCNVLFVFHYFSFSIDTRLYISTIFEEKVSLVVYRCDLDS